MPKPAGSGSHVENGVGEEGAAPSQVGGQLRVHLRGQRLSREGHLGHSVDKGRSAGKEATLASPLSSVSRARLARRTEIKVETSDAQ